MSAWFGYEAGEIKDGRELGLFRAVGGGFTALYPPVMHWVGALVSRSGSIWYQYCELWRSGTRRIEAADGGIMTVVCAAIAAEEMGGVAFLIPSYIEGGVVCRSDVVV